MTAPSRRRATLAAATLAVGGLVLALAVAMREGGSWRPGVLWWMARGTGWTALGLLMLALCVTPAGAIARRLGGGGGSHWVTPLRRALGIAAASLALVHAAVALGGYLRGAWAAVWSWPYLRAGLVALLVLTALLATSFPAVVRRLRIRHWKVLHRLAYAAAALTLVHLLLSPFAPRAITVGLFAALLLVGLGRALGRAGRGRAVE